MAQVPAESVSRLYHHICKSAIVFGFSPVTIDAKMVTGTATRRLSTLSNVSLRSPAMSLNNGVRIGTFISAVNNLRRRGMIKELPPDKGNAMALTASRMESTSLKSYIPDVSDRSRPFLPSIGDARVNGAAVVLESIPCLSYLVPCFVKVRIVFDLHRRNLHVLCEYNLSLVVSKFNTATHLPLRRNLTDAVIKKICTSSNALDSMLTYLRPIQVGWHAVPCTFLTYSSCVFASFDEASVLHCLRQICVPYHLLDT